MVKFNNNVIPGKGKQNIKINIFYIFLKVPTEPAPLGYHGGSIMCLPHMDCFAVTTVLIKDMKAMGPQSGGFVHHLCLSYWVVKPCSFSRFESQV